MYTNREFLAIFIVACLGGCCFFTPTSYLPCQARPVHCASSSSVEYTFQDLGIPSFNVSFQQQRKQATFTTSLQGQCQANISLRYFLDPNAPSITVDMYLNQNRTEGVLHPLQTCNHFLLNTTLEERNTFTFMSDIPSVYRLTIFGNSTIALSHRTGATPNDLDADSNLPLLNTCLKITLAASFVVPILVGIYFERYRSNTGKRDKKEKNEHESVVL